MLECKVLGVACNVNGEAVSSFSTLLSLLGVRNLLGVWGFCIVLQKLHWVLGISPSRVL